MMRSTERGFTLPEVITVLAVLITLLAASALFVRPKSYADTDNDANRRLGLAALAQGIKEYHMESGSWPGDIPDKATPIANQDGYNLCPKLVPAYLKDMPFDPQSGFAYTGEEDNLQPTLDSCNVEGVIYNTGYQIRKTKDDLIVLSAPGAVTGRLEITVR